MTGVTVSLCDCYTQLQWHDYNKEERTCTD